MDFLTELGTEFATGIDQDGCGGHFITAPGQIMSPTYPLQYSNDALCTYVIQAEAGKVVRITFSQFDLEGGGPHCPYDWVIIYDGNPYTTQPERYCGSTTAPPTITTVSNLMTVEFRSDSSVTYGGFLASYDFLDNPTVGTCPANMVHGECSCRGTCEEPGGSTGCRSECEIGSEGCFCPGGFLMNGEECILPNECPCFWSEIDQIIPEGQTYVNSDCTRIAACSNGLLTLNDGYACSSNGECEEREGVRRCYCDEGYSGDGKTCTPTIQTDCMDVYNAGFTSNGIYTIKPTNWSGVPFNVSCDMIDGGGWTVFQRRMDGTVDFYLDWETYKVGFGSVSGEHWLGNEKLYYITTSRNYQLRVDVVDEYGVPFYATYSSFRISNETDKYELSSLGSHAGSAGDAMTYSLDKPFTTIDRDNDDTGENCAVLDHGAWWYSNCVHANLNGDYHHSARERSGERGFCWRFLPDRSYDDCRLNFSEMKIRPV